MTLIAEQTFAKIIRVKQKTLTIHAQTIKIVEWARLVSLELASTIQ